MIANMLVTQRHAIAVVRNDGDDDDDSLAATVEQPHKGGGGGDGEDDSDGHTTAAMTMTPTAMQLQRSQRFDRYSILTMILQYSHNVFVFL